MVEIRLHGPLAASHGKVWHLDVENVQEAVQAIEANMRGFRQKIVDLAKKGMVFRVRSKTHDYDNEDVHTSLGNVSRIDIIPIVLGASAGVRFVIGAVLVVAGLLITGGTYGAAAPFGSALISLGVSMMVGSIAEWLTPKAKGPDDQSKGLQSWTISGPTNTVDQGLPVPVIYGEVLTGGYAISGGISVSQLANGTTSQSVTINGISEVSDPTGGGGTFTSKLKFSVSPFNIEAPFTYIWSYTGFAGATAVRLIGSTSAGLALEVDFPALADELITTYTGVISVTVTGVREGLTVSATATKNISMTMDTRVYVSPGDGGGVGPGGPGGDGGVGGGGDF